MNASLGLKHRVLIVSFRYPTLLIDADIRLWDGPMGRSPSQSLRQTSAHNLPIPEGQHQSPLAEVCFWFWQLSHEGLGLKKASANELWVRNLESREQIHKIMTSQQKVNISEELEMISRECSLGTVLPYIFYHPYRIYNCNTWNISSTSFNISIFASKLAFAWHVTNSSSIIEGKLSPWR